LDLLFLTWKQSVHLFSSLRTGPWQTLEKRIHSSVPQNKNWKYRMTHGDRYTFKIVASDNWNGNLVKQNYVFQGNRREDWFINNKYPQKYKFCISLYLRIFSLEVGTRTHNNGHAGMIWSKVVKGSQITVMFVSKKRAFKRATVLRVLSWRWRHSEELKGLWNKGI